MPFHDIPLADGTAIPAIAFGSGSVNRRKDIHEYIENAINAGFSHLDTAQFYENEESVGIAIRESGLSREDLYVTTKWDPTRPDIRTTLEESLSKLGLKYVDLFLIHMPLALEGNMMENVWRQFEEVREAGLTKSIGVSNFSVDHLQQLLKVARIKPVVNQIRFHPYNWAEIKDLVEFHVKHGIVTEAYSSLSPITKYPGGPVDAVLAKVAERLGATPAQVIFAWVRAKGAVIVTTTSKRERLEEYLAAGDLPNLTPEEITAIDQAGSQGPPSALNLVSSLKQYWHHLLILPFLFMVLFFYLHGACFASGTI